MFSSRRARVATLIAAGVIGFGGVAAAGGGFVLPDTPDVTPAPQEIEVEEEVEVEEVEQEVEAITTTTAATAGEESETFADEIANAYALDTPEVEHARAEIARVRG